MNLRFLVTLFIAVFLFFDFAFANDTVVFNNIFKSTSYTTSQLNSVSAVSGSGFKFVTTNATIATSLTGNNVNGSLIYYDGTNSVAIPGTATGVTQTDKGIIFTPTSGSDRYLLVLPTYESNFTAGSNYKFNSSGSKADLEAAKTTQDATVVVTISEPAAVAESASGSYIDFTVTFSKSRSLNSSVSFTPSLVSGTAVSGSDFSSTIQYSTNNSTWLSAASGITVTYNTNTIYLRVTVTDDTRPEVDETFTIKTNAFTGAGSSEISNNSGTFSTGTISDNNDPLVWTGSSSTSFSTSSNWSPNDLTPSSDYTISISSGKTNYPEVSGNASVKDLVIQSGAKLTVNNNMELAVKGNVTNNGQAIGDGTLTLSGASAQTINGIGDYKNLKIDNSSGVTISNDGSTMVNMKGVLSLNRGQLTTNQKLTLKSLAADEGILGTVNCANSASVSGNVIVERLIPGSQRAFRFLTPGVTTTGTIRDNWQEGQNNTSTIYANYQNNTPRYGTHITGSTTGLNGFDATLTGNPSLFRYNSATQAWASVSSTNNTSTNLMKYGEAYRILIRGSRAINMNTNTPVPDSTTIRTTGQLCYCEATFNSAGSGTNVVSGVSLSTVNDSWSFIGNPYWAYVDWHTLNRQDIGNVYYAWDPTIAGTNNRGGFEAWIYNPSTNSGQKQNSGSSSKLDRYIQPGQAFFVKTTGPNPSITFNEKDKYTASNGKKAIFSINLPDEVTLSSINSFVGNSSSNRISIVLYLKENLDKNIADAATLLYANGWSDELGVDDADKLSNPDENLALVRANKKFAFEGRSALANHFSDSVDLTLWNLNQRSYILRVDAKDFTANHELFLVDKTSGQKYQINKGEKFDLPVSPASGQKILDNFYLLLNKPLLNISPINRKVDKGIKIYPNPATNQVNITFGADVVLSSVSEVTISDLNAQRIFSQTISNATNNTISVDVSSLPIGTYIVELISGDKKYRQKMIKK